MPAAFLASPDRLMNLIPGKGIALSLRVEWEKYKIARSDKTTWRKCEGLQTSARQSEPPHPRMLLLGGSAWLSPSSALLAGEAHPLHFGSFFLFSFYSFAEKKAAQRLCAGELLLLLRFLAQTESLDARRSSLSAGWEQFQSVALPSGSAVLSTLVFFSTCIFYLRR